MKIVNILLMFALAQSITAGSEPEEYDASVYLAATFSVSVSSRFVGQSVARIPTPLSQRLPEYPMNMRQQCVSGICVLKLAFDPAGRFTVVKVIKESDPTFTHSAVEAVNPWRFAPARSQDKAVQSEMDYTFRYAVSFEDPA